MSKIYVVPGKRIPFMKAGKEYSQIESIGLSAPVIRELANTARPDFVVWGQVIPDPTISNLGREMLLEAELDPSIPAFSTQLACATSAMASIQAAGMIGKGGAELAIAGGVEIDEPYSYCPEGAGFPTVDGGLPAGSRRGHEAVSGTHPR